jgi:antitoxin (DNA-binding transcriptional repressor) of toxin-antitoxin stability system
MKSIAIRDLHRQRWAKIEAVLQVEEEILITCHSKPVAKLVLISRPVRKRKRWDPEKHKKWIKKVYGNKTLPSSDAALARARADRWEMESS